MNALVARRRLILTIAALVLVLLGMAYWLISGRYSASTENAYVGGNVVMITAQVGGVVTAIGADDTDRVHAGQTVIRLDDTDARVALERARAQLALAVRQVRASYAAAGTTRANIEMREVALARAEADVAHRRGLLAIGAVSGEEVRHAEQAVRAASAALQMAREQGKGSLAAVDRTSLQRNPAVRSAAAQVRAAYVALQRTVIPAPVAGVVTRRHVQVGERIAPGAPLMAVVPLDQLWVDANFKESQLRNVRIGQPVTLTADLYGGDVVYHGMVEGQEPGTGNAFSLLPAQNATGNWIKVVQRVPVRIALRPREVERHPLQLGLSMHVEVATRNRSGQRLTAADGRTHGYRTDVYAHQLAHADAMVAAIIKANQ
ncbi:MAG TPA: efflux RND transporter periplasmic adaptor subunit [Rhodanobacteraceae bacterium]|nr:efflux RND transporter periplasmic adaptor subunit [Rhodanobacteraceae bacterium]